MTAKWQLHISCVILITFLLIGGSVYSQSTRDVSRVESGMANEGKTRALIIGISKYQYIDSLQYADRDAQVFAEYLKSNSFWHVGKDDITLLVNDKAKNGDLITQLARIAKASNPGDNLLFYFSGHGDVETITQFNNGFLLAYDTYTNNYIAGALPISFLKELFVTLLNKNVKVLLVTDACRSGKLAGGMKGAEFAATAISNMWKNEIKILSSQPGQLSFEGTKWGNGRGVFSYYLVKGLNGEADANKDSSITLAELEMFVGNNVARETGNKQQPIFEGPNKYSTILATLSPPVILANPKPGGNQYIPPKKIFRVPEDTCLHYYREFLEAIEKNKFDNGDPRSASTLYNKLKACSRDTNMVLQANSQLLAGLMNSAQEIVNNSFIGQKLVGDKDFDKGIALIDQIIGNNDLQLPYDQHMRNLNRYFLVMQKTTNDSAQSNYSLDQLDRMMDSALVEEPDAAYLLTAKSRIEMKRENWENAIELQQRSLEKSPGWLTPKYYLGMAYGNKKSYDKAIEFYEEVYKKDSLNQTFECTKCAFKMMAEWARKLKMDKKSAEYFLKSMEFFPVFPEIPDPFENEFFMNHPGKDSSGNPEVMPANPSFNRNLRKQLEKQLAGLPIPGYVLDSIKIGMVNRDDSAGFYFTRGLLSKKDPGKPDSSTYFYKKAIELDPDEIFFMETLIDHLQEAGKEDLVQSFLPSRINNYHEEERMDLRIMLAASYLKSRKLRQAFLVYKGMIEAGEFSCADLKKLDTEFGKLPEYNQYMKTCKDRKPEGDRDDDEN